MFGLCRAPTGPIAEGWEKEKVIEYIRSQSGLHFDPTIVGCFMQLISDPETRTEADNPGR